MTTPLNNLANLQEGAPCHLPDTFSGRKHYESEDMFILCHVTASEHMFKRLSELMGEATTLSCLVAIGQVQVER